MYMHPILGGRITMLLLTVSLTLSALPGLTADKTKTTRYTDTVSVSTHPG